MTDPGFRSVGIVGFGLMGGSLARDLKNLTSPPFIRGHSLEAADLEEGLSRGILDEAVEEPGLFFRDLDLVVYGTPLTATLELLSHHESLMPPDALLTDLVSLKGPVLDRMKALGLSDRYVGSHPMVGGEGRGFSASREGLFRKARVWLVAEGAAPPNQDRIRAFWESVGARPACIDAQTHDRTMVWVSHLPQLVSNALGKALAEAGFLREDLGPGGRDMTRLAGSSPEMWEDLFRSVSGDLPGALAALEEGVRDLRERLEDGKAEEVAELMDRTRTWIQEGRWS